MPIGPDGTVKVEIDTALAKAMHADQDHRYAIQAEVVDQSRRTIVGNGAGARGPQAVQVYAWVDRGYYRVGDTIDASFAARTLDGKPVEGDGQAAAAEDHLRRTRAQAGRDRSPRMGPRHERRGPGRDADQGVRAGPVSPVVHA